MEQDMQSNTLQQKKKGCRAIHFFIFIGLLGLNVLSFVLMCKVKYGNYIYNIIGWIIATICSYMLPLFICLKKNGLPYSLCNQKGGYIILAIYVLINTANIFISPIIGCILFLILGFYLITGFSEIASAFSPTGKIRIEKHEADGSINVEEHYVYTDVNAEMNKVKEQLKNEGYTNRNE